MHLTCPNCKQRISDSIILAQQRNCYSCDQKRESVAQTSTMLEALVCVLHTAAMSRIALVPTVHASSVQTSNEVKKSIPGGRLDDNGDGVVLVTEETTESGWDRLREAMFCNKEEGLSRELYEVTMMFLLGGMLGFAYGGFPASRHARQRYIQQSQAQIYHSKLEATGSSYNAASRGMIRYGYRWGWRTALLAGGYHGISTGLAIFRNTQDIFCYSIAGVSTGVLYRVNLGLRGMVGGAFVGGLLGIPCGIILMGFQRILGETFIEKHRRERAERRAERAQEMAFRMQVTPQMMGHMEDSLKESNKLIQEKKLVESAA